MILTFKVQNRFDFLKMLISDHANIDVTPLGQYENQMLRFS